LYVSVERDRKAPLHDNEGRSRMLELTVSERAFLAHRRALTTNAAGQEVLVGLTHQQSLDYIDCCRQQSNRDATAQLAFAELGDRHEAARDAVIDVEEMLVSQHLHRQSVAQASAYR
jgi:hypothetical protein